MSYLKCPFFTFKKTFKYNSLSSVAKHMTSIGKLATVFFNYCLNLSNLNVICYNPLTLTTICDSVNFFWTYWTLVCEFLAIGMQLCPVFCLLGAFLGTLQLMALIIAGAQFMIRNFLIFNILIGLETIQSAILDWSWNDSECDTKIGNW